MTLRRPNRATSHPVIGVVTAVASMLNVIVQAISSCVADIAPCICGKRVEAISSVVEYSVDPSTIESMIMIRRGTLTGSSGWSSEVILWIRGSGFGGPGPGSGFEECRLEE